MIISRTPFRVSLFGGGTDYPAWYLEHGGQVLSTAIDKYCYISCRTLPPFFDYRYRVAYSRLETVQSRAEIQHPAVRAVLEYLDYPHGVAINYDGDLPARSGLGTSSSFTTGLLNALHAMEGRFVGATDLARQALHVEQHVIGEPVGSQDQIAAAFGGFNRIRFLTDGRFEVEPVIMPLARKEALNEHLMLFFTGISRHSAVAAASKIERLAENHDHMRALSTSVDEALSILSGDGSLTVMGKLLDAAWQVKRQLSDKVSTAQIDDLYEAAKSAGALGGKLLGAGGGGFLLLFAQPARQAAIRKRLQKLIHVPFGFDSTGSRIVLHQPDGLH